MNATAHYSRAAARLLLALVLGFGAARAQEPSFARQVEARTLALVNALRSEHGVPPLEREPRLEHAADELAGYMANARRLDHRADGTTPATRVKARGYTYCNLAENIAVEYDSRGFTAERLAARIVEGWRNSPSHRDNLLERNATQTGIGIARSAAGEYYAAQLFARPRLPGVARGAACPR